MAVTRLSLLIRLRRGGDITSWDEFHAVYRPFLFRFAISRGLSESDANDVVQEIFLRLLRVLREFEFDPQRARFRTWLKRVARNSIVDWRRKQGRRRERSIAFEHLDSLAASPAKFDWEAEHRAGVVRHSLANLRAETRPLTWQCFEEHVLRGRTAGQVAAETGLTVNGVYINAARTLQRLRRKCEQFDQELCDGGDRNLS